MRYFRATNTGKGFITHEDNEASYIQGHLADIYTTDNEDWARRVGALEVTIEIAQEHIDDFIDAEELVYPEDYEDESLRGQPLVYTLPTGSM